MILRLAKRFLPWFITVVALFYTFHDVDWSTLSEHIGEADPLLILSALSLTIISYVLRSRRWQFLFVKPVLTFADSLRVLFFGFFMNNVLPARAGEFVRAHYGSKVTNEKRTVVLASIASERLLDGLTLSAIFVIFALGVGDEELSHNLLYVAYLFGIVGIGVVFTIICRDRLFSLLEKLAAKINHKASDYTTNRIQIFINGLTPLCSKNRLPYLILWSIVIWGVELYVYIAISKGFGSSLSLVYCVLFLVAVNFSSLIPAAPGGIGVIEAVASKVLVSVGVKKELALAMVLTQHIIQYLVIAVGGAISMYQLRANPNESILDQNGER